MNARQPSGWKLRAPRSARAVAAAVGVVSVIAALTVTVSQPVNEGKSVADAPTPPTSTATKASPTMKAPPWDGGWIGPGPFKPGPFTGGWIGG